MQCILLSNAWRNYRNRLISVSSNRSTDRIIGAYVSCFVNTPKAENCDFDRRIRLHKAAKKKKRRKTWKTYTSLRRCCCCQSAMIRNLLRGDSQGTNRHGSIYQPIPVRLCLDYIFASLEIDFKMAFSHLMLVTIFRIMKSSSDCASHLREFVWPHCKGFTV